jgi:hypothetical protein
VTTYPDYSGLIDATPAPPAAPTQNAALTSGNTDVTHGSGAAGADTSYPPSRAYVSEGVREGIYGGMGPAAPSAPSLVTAAEYDAARQALTQAWGRLLAKLKKIERAAGQVGEGRATELRLQYVKTLDTLTAGAAAVITEAVAAEDARQAAARAAEDAAMEAWFAQMRKADDPHGRPSWAQ